MIIFFTKKIKKKQSAKVYDEYCQIYTYNAFTNVLPGTFDPAYLFFYLIV